MPSITNASAIANINPVPPGLHSVASLVLDTMRFFHMTMSDVPLATVAAQAMSNNSENPFSLLLSGLLSCLARPVCFRCPQ